MLFKLFLLINIFISVKISALTLNLKDGTPCIWQDRIGICVSIYKCLSAAIDAKNRDPPPICSNKPGSPKTVCCTDCQLVKDTRNLVFDKSLGIHPRPTEISQQYCFKLLRELEIPCKRRTSVSFYKVNTQLKGANCSVLRRVTRFKKNFYSRYSWNEDLVHLAYLGYAAVNKAVQWLCGGALISEYFILTAAHCIDIREVGFVTHVGLGRRTGSFEHWHEYRVKFTIIHPSYRAPARYHDIALIRTETRVIFHSWVMSACLPTENDMEQRTAMAAGIGNYTNPRHIIGSYHVQLERFSSYDCMFLFPPNNLLPYGFHDMTQRCYGYKNRLNNPCGTDSGAPLQWQHANYSCGLSIIGITAIERTCEDENEFGLYTNVFFYKSWIERIVWPDK